MGNMIGKKMKEVAKDNMPPVNSNLTEENQNNLVAQYESDLEAIKKENIKIENELSELKEKYNAYQSKMENFEFVIGELADKMSRVATGHSAFMTKLHGMEKQIKKVSRSQTLIKKTNIQSNRLGENRTS